MQLVLGAGTLDRYIANPEKLLLDYREDEGYAYIKHDPISRGDTLCLEDIAVTLLVNSRASRQAVRSLQTYGHAIDLRNLPSHPLERVPESGLTSLAQFIGTVASWPGFAASMATKVLHKKRPDLVPILDNQAIFGAYMSPTWPERPSSQDSVRNVARIEQALRWIRADVTRAENEAAWSRLAEIEPAHTRIELFDSVWWMYFRAREPRR